MSAQQNVQNVIVAGFIPLTDCAILVVAKEKGFAAAENIDLVLVRETSWANIRDRIGVGHFDIAHMLAPMALAANLGLAPLPAKLIAPMALGAGGNTITISSALHERMRAHGASGDGDPAASARALALALTERAGKRPPVFAIVHPYSSHHYELALWLRSAGLVPGRDVELNVLPPGLMADALASGQIEGFCAGEPWGSVAAASGAGGIVTTSLAIWRASPGKVLGVRQDWAEGSGAQLPGLIRAMWRAAQWSDEPENREELAALLASGKYLAQPREVIATALCQAMPQNSCVTSAPGGMFRFSGIPATFPWRSQALWYYAQMVLAGQVPYSRDGAAVAAACYRPDLFRQALAPLGVGMPASDIRIEGAAETGEDRFFDHRTFDPGRVEDYVGGGLV